MFFLLILYLNYIYIGYLTPFSKRYFFCKIQINFCALAHSFLYKGQKNNMANKQFLRIISQNACPMYIQKDFILYTAVHLAVKG